MAKRNYLKRNENVTLELDAIFDLKMHKNPFVAPVGHRLDPNGKFTALSQTS